MSWLEGRRLGTRGSADAPGAAASAGGGNADPARGVQRPAPTGRRRHEHLDGLGSRRGEHGLDLWAGQQRRGRHVVVGGGARPVRDVRAAGLWGQLSGVDAGSGLLGAGRSHPLLVVQYLVAAGSPEPAVTRPAQRSATPSRRRTRRAPPAGTPSPSGTRARPLAAALRRQRVAGLAAGPGRDVPVVGDAQRDPVEVQPAVALAGERVLGAGRDLGTEPVRDARGGPGAPGGRSTRSSPATTPGCPAARTPARRATNPNASGLAGLIATWRACSDPSRSSATFT